MAVEGTVLELGPGSEVRLVRDRLKAAMSLNAVRGCSAMGDPGGWDPSRLVLELCSTNATSESVTCWWVSLPSGLE